MTAGLARGGLDYTVLRTFRAACSAWAAEACAASCMSMRCKHHRICTQVHSLLRASVC
jgi:hypothetical protein